MGKQKIRFVPLSEDLEKLVICAVMRGLVPETDVHEEELSKIGKVVLRGISNLRSLPDCPDLLVAQSVQVAAAEVLGADRREVGNYIAACSRIGAGREVPDLLRAVREKTLLVEILNEAGNQLATGRLDAGKVNDLIHATEFNAPVLQSAADLLVNGIPPEPCGLKLRSLPLLSQASGGLMGMWAIAAEPGVGKSTLVMQICLDWGKYFPVLYYDLENGDNVMLHRIGKAFGMDDDEARRNTGKIYLREGIRSLTTDLRAFRGKKCLLVVDSLQKLPTNAEHRRTSLDVWVHRFEALKKQGHTVILISEKSREDYGKASMRGFKETGEIEYSADFGFQLVGVDGLPGMAELIVVKNRHRPHTGKICSIERVNGFRFQERV